MYDPINFSRNTSLATITVIQGKQQMLITPKIYNIAKYIIDHLVLQKSYYAKILCNIFLIDLRKYN